MRARRHHRPRRRSRGGFTLIEVMVALGIMVVIGVLAFSTLAGSVEMRDIMEETDKVSRSARVALDRLTRELQLAFLTTNVNVNTFLTVFVGKEETDGSVLWFSTMAHRRAYRNSRESDLAEVTVWAEDDPEGSRHMVLLHRESSLIDHEPDRGGKVQLLARDVTRFQVRFLNPQTAEWMEEWDTAGVETPNQLPRAVQIVLGIAAPDPDDPDDFVEEVFVRTVYIERAQPISAGPLNAGARR